MNVDFDGIITVVFGAFHKLSLDKYPSQPTNIMRGEAPPIAKYMYLYNTYSYDINVGKTTINHPTTPQSSPLIYIYVCLVNG